MLPKNEGRKPGRGLVQNASFASVLRRHPQPLMVEHQAKQRTSESSGVQRRVAYMCACVFRVVEALGGDVRRSIVSSRVSWNRGGWWGRAAAEKRPGGPTVEQRTGAAGVSTSLVETSRALRGMR